MKRCIKLRLNLELEQLEDANLVIYLHSVVRGYGVNTSNSGSLASDLEGQLRPLVAEALQVHQKGTLEQHLLTVDHWAKLSFQKASQQQYQSPQKQPPKADTQPSSELDLNDIEL